MHIGAGTAGAASTDPPPDAEPWPVDALVIEYRYANLTIAGDQGGSFALTIGRVGAGQPAALLASFDDDHQPASDTRQLEPATFDEVFARLLDAGLEDIADEAMMCTDSPTHQLTVSFGGSTIADVLATDCGSQPNPAVEAMQFIVEPARALFAADASD